MTRIIKAPLVICLFFVVGCACHRMEVKHEDNKASRSNKYIHGFREELLKSAAKPQKEGAPAGPSSVRDHFVLSYESPLVYFPYDGIKIRVWDTGLIKSWPGLQPQIIQILDSTGNVLSAREVGGEPMMRDAWIATHDSRLFVYIQCLHRRRSAPGVYVYEITRDLQIEEKGIYFDTEDLKKESELQEEIIQNLKKDKHFRELIDNKETP